MPNRILKESICTSDSVDELSWFEEVVFYRLIVNCDDYGRMDGRPKLLRARLFPLKSVTDKQISDAVQSLRTAGIVDLYYVDGRPFLQLRTWDKHQRVRAKQSKYPAPESTCCQMSASRGQMSANDSETLTNAPVIQSNPIQSESKSESNTRDAQFELFWDAYPRKVGKIAAKKAFLKTSEEIFPDILRAIEEQKLLPQWQKNDGEFIPYPATWLNQGRWEDDVNGNLGQIAEECTNRAWNISYDIDGNEE